MTREEAKEVFLNQGFINGIFDGDKWRQSIIVILELLDQELCDDCISRQAVLDLIEYYNSDGLGTVFFGYKQGVKFADAINKLPTVTPQLESEVEK